MQERPYNDGLSWTLLAVYACDDDADCGYQNVYRAFIPDTTGTVTVRLASGGSTYAIPVVAGAVYPIHNIYSFDATDTDSTNVVLLG